MKISSIDIYNISVYCFPVAQFQKWLTYVNFASFGPISTPYFCIILKQSQKYFIHKYLSVYLWKISILFL